MQIFIYCKVTLHVSGVTAPIIRSTKNWREGAVPVLLPVPEAAVTVFSTPDDGYCDTRNMYSDFAINKYLHTVASGWIFINIVTIIICRIFSTFDNDVIKLWIKFNLL